MNLKPARGHVIKENVQLVEGLLISRNKKWRKYEGRVGASHEKLKRNLDRFKFANISDRQKRQTKMLINKTKSVVLVQAEAQMIPSQGHVFLNSSSNVMDTLSPREKLITR